MICHGTLHAPKLVTEYSIAIRHVIDRFDRLGDEERHEQRCRRREHTSAAHSVNNRQHDELQRGSTPGTLQTDSRLQPYQQQEAQGRAAERQHPV